MKRGISKVVIISVILLAALYVFGIGSNNEHMKVAVLMYHHLIPEDEIKQGGHEGNNAILPVENFCAQMEILRQQGFHTATMEELECFLNGEAELPPKTVVITFDDGYYSNIEYAYPVMKENNQKGTIFMIGSLALRKEDGWLRYIKCNDIPEYEDVFDFESHSYDLHREKEGRSFLVCEPSDLVREDIIKNKELLDASYFSYPYGQYSNAAVKMLAKTGHRLAFTTKRGYVTSRTNPYKIPRFAINSNTTPREFEDIINGDFKREIWKHFFNSLTKTGPIEYTDTKE